MTRSIHDQAAIILHPSLRTTDVLDLSLDNISLDLDQHLLFHELDRRDACELQIPDFRHAGSDYTIHVWEFCCDGGPPSPWSHNGFMAVSGPRGEMEADLVVLAAPSGDLVLEPEHPNGPPPPNGSKAVIRVKVRKKGSKPL